MIHKRLQVITIEMEDVPKAFFEGFCEEVAKDCLAVVNRKARQALRKIKDADISITNFDAPIKPKR